jgi:signal transduction histidine kinase
VADTRRSAAPSVGFRRNIKWFLGALVGFFVTINLVLLLLLQNAIAHAEGETQRSRSTAAEAAAAAVDAEGPAPSNTALDSVLVTLQSRLGPAGIALARPDGTLLRSGQTSGDLRVIERPTAAGTIQLFFDQGPLADLESGFRWVAGIVIFASVGGVALFMILLPRVVRPIDMMLEDARALGERSDYEAEDHYLIETFRRSISTLQEQERELRRLHDYEKTRADDLERITATLTRSLTSGFIAFDTTGRIVDVNRSAREILRLPEERPSSGSIREVLGAGTLAETLQSVFDQREALTRHELIAEEEGLVIGLTTVPLRNEEQNFLGMLVLFTDLSRVRRLESSVREMQALADLGQMAAGIAHELRNSLGTILGYLKLARRQPDESRREDKLAEAEEEGRRLSESIAALLNFAKPVEIDREIVELSSLLAAVVKRLAIEDRGIELRLTTPPAEVEGDAALLGSVFENLVRNAVEALEDTEHPVLSVESKEDSEGVLVIVEDNGCGIRDELLPGVFLPFRSGKASGTGLGLALARKIVLLHGGSIELVSRDGVGTVVRTRLPGRE